MFNMSPLSTVRLACASALCALVISCEEEKQGSPTLPPAKVEVTPLLHEDVKVTSEWVGTLRGTEDAEIRPQVTGYLLSKDYQDGAFVKKGQVLFSLDDRPFVAALNQAKASLQQAQANLLKNKQDVERYTALVKTNSVSEKNLTDAVQAMRESEGAVALAKAKVDEAEINLKFTSVTSPVSGLAGVASPSVGNLLSSNSTTPLTTVSAMDPIRVDFGVSEKEFLSAFNATPNDANRPDLPLTITLSNGTVCEQKGMPAALDRNVNRNTGTIGVVGLISNPDHRLRPGMSVRVSAQTEMIKNAALVPPRAIMSAQSAYFIVSVDANDMPHMVPVIPGVIYGRYQVVTGVKGDLPEQMSVVVEGIQQAAQRAKMTGVKVIPVPYVDKLSTPTVISKGAENFDAAKDPAAVGVKSDKKEEAAPETTSK